MSEPRGLNGWDLAALAVSMATGTLGTMMLGGYYFAPHAPGTALISITLSMILFAYLLAGLPDEAGDPDERPPQKAALD